MKVGISGHQHLDNERLWVWVGEQLARTLSKLPAPLTAVSSLAIGADQLFARLVLETGGDLEAVLPFAKYESVFQAEDRASFKVLLRRAASIQILEAQASPEESYFEAGKTVVNRSALMIFIWDEKPARGLGGTADIFEYAQQQRKPLVLINPSTKAVISS